MRTLKLDCLSTLASVLELGSFSAAAERLQLSQPAVSLRVRQLERQLGVRLVERVGRRATPTAAGRDLLAHIDRIDAAIADALEAVAAHAAGTLGRVRLGSGATACIHLLPPVLRDLRARHPALEIVVSTGNTPDIVKAVEENALDVAFVTLPASGRMLQVTPVLEDDFVAIFPAGQADIPPHATPALLVRRPLVLYEPGANTRRIVDGWLRRAGTRPTPVMELGSVEAIVELVAAGLGCSVLPLMAIGESGRRHRVALRPLRPRLRRKLAIVLRRDKPLHRGLREVVRALREIRD